MVMTSDHVLLLTATGHKTMSRFGLKGQHGAQVKRFETGHRGEFPSLWGIRRMLQYYWNFQNIIEWPLVAFPVYLPSIHVNMSLKKEKDTQN